MQFPASTPNEPTFAFDALPLYWQMSRWEKFAFAKLLDTAQPEVAIEIGTFKGGSLQMIAHVAREVHSIDIKPDHRPMLQEHFDNVVFHTGQSRELLPPLLEKLQAENAPLGLVLIDGEHTLAGVRDDINAVLKFQPSRPLYVVFHDSFNPDCRAGILAADWAAHPHVHFVEVDFVPGMFFRDGFDEAPPRSMYGGLAVAVLMPEKRSGELVVHQTLQGQWETLYRQSCHASAQGLSSLPARIKNKLRRLLG